jgi:AmiR/NasT family two-component response regulator
MATPVSNRVAQASGMVSVQANCHFTEAIALMEQRAAETGKTLDAIAQAVVDREIRFGN